MRLFVLVGFGLMVACASTASNEESATSGADVTSGEQPTMNAAADDSCTATLHFLQKDAYKNGAGRSSDLWPPHTTTILSVTCQTANGPQTIAPFDNNHGTLPDAKDANGTTILVDVAMDPNVVTTTAPWSEMQKLVTTYESCECQPDTFLSLDAVTPNALPIVNEVASLFDCQQPVTDLLAAAKAKNVDQVKDILAGCTLKPDVSLEDFEKTAADVETAVKSTLSGKHVCNNDALLQADLFTHFRDTKEVTACNPHDANRCQFPSLFFRPAVEVK
jgi:hypothetical protein